MLWTRSDRSANFMASFQIFNNENTLTTHTHTHHFFLHILTSLLFGIFSNHRRARWHRSMRGIFASSAEVNYRAVWMQSQLRLRLRLWKCQCEFVNHDNFSPASDKVVCTPTNQYVSVLTKWNESNCIVCATKRQNICHFTHRNPIQFKIENVQVSPIFALICCSLLSHSLFSCQFLYHLISCRLNLAYLFLGIDVAVGCYL